MASVDGTSSLLSASDEMFEHVCEPCKNEGNKKEARQYCWDCQEYLCDECVKHHKKVTLTKNHKIESADSVTAGQGRYLIVHCSCINNKATEFYCEDHADVICSTCKSFQHNQCQTLPVRQKSSGYTASNLETIMARAKTTKNKYDQLKQECSANQKELKLSKEECKKEIQSFRKDLDEFLDNLERDMLSECDQLELKERQRIEEQMTLLSTALQTLDTVCNFLEKARKDGGNETMFSADIQTSKGLRDFENRCDDLEKKVGHIHILFEKNKQLDNLKREIKKIGSLSACSKNSMKRETTVLVGGHIQSRKMVTIRQTDDTRDPNIRGCAVMPNDSIVICDYNNNKIKLLDNSLTLTQSLELPRPWDVSVSDTNNVVITSPDSRKLHFIQVFPKLKLGRVIQLDKYCWGVHVAADALYVTCHDAYDNKVRVFDKQGNFMRRLGVSLSYPDYITVNTAGNKVFVSDWGSHTITCMTADGSIIYQYKDNDLKYPLGIYCNDEDNILVCGESSNNVQLITADGRKGGTLLSAADGLKQPCSITYRKSDNTLIVGCKNILVFTVAK